MRLYAIDGQHSREWALNCNSISLLPATIARDLLAGRTVHTLAGSYWIADPTVTPLPSSVFVRLPGLPGFAVAEEVQS